MTEKKISTPNTMVVLLLQLENLWLTYIVHKFRGSTVQSQKDIDSQRHFKVPAGVSDEI